MSEQQQQQQITQFLDLTNGEGGERLDETGSRQTDNEDYDFDDADDDGTGGRMDDDDDDDDTEDGASFNIDSNNTASAASARVVDTGSEHTGRWTKEEHQAFLTALHLYGKEWKKVAARVKTRTVVQTRTHAQKYFQKIQKTEPKKARERKQGSISPKKQQQQAIATPTTTPSSSLTKLNRRSSNATLSAAQVITTLSQSKAFAPQQQQQQKRTILHGFYSDTDVMARQRPTATMKIVAPDPSTSMLHHGFPEPSPAATGKRKLAELAAARMLAGVHDDSPPTPPLSTPPLLFGSNTTTTANSAAAAATSTSFARNHMLSSSLQIVNPSSLGVTVDHQQQKRQHRESPVTPWDGQMEELVSNNNYNQATTTAHNVKDASLAAESPWTDTKQDNVYGPATLSSSLKSPLVTSICEMNISGVQQELAKGNTYLHQLDQAGFAPIHAASSLGVPAVAKEIVDFLLAAGADPAMLDGHGNTSLHWAARVGDADTARLLVHRNCPLDVKNKDGETPLHWSMRAGRIGLDVTTVLLQMGARHGVLNKFFRRPIDVAAFGFLDDANSFASLSRRDENGKKVSQNGLKKAFLESAVDRKACRTNFLIRSPQSKTLVLHHPECLNHHTKTVTDWEAPDRVRSIMRRVLPSSDSTGVTETSGIFPHEITVSQEFDRAKLDLLSRVHSTEYLSFVNELSKDLERQQKDGAPADDYTDLPTPPPPVVPFTPHVQRATLKVAGSVIKLGATSDTSFSAGSLKAARRAAGAVQHAVDWYVFVASLAQSYRVFMAFTNLLLLFFVFEYYSVLVGRNRNAFCVVRPPGHHAGVSGLLEGGESCGFCIFNNVAAGALYAISEDRLLCQRCAVVDIDVHHGNGTEEIVRKCNDPSKLFFFSIHLYDNDKKKRSANQFQYKFYPGTGNEDDLALNIINVPIVPLWKDSAPAVGPAIKKTHNTRQNRVKSPQDSQDDASDIGTPREGSKASDVESEVGSTNTSASSLRPAASSSGRLAYRQAIQNRLLPALRAFNPDLILISAGFDAAKGDVGNARHERGGRERMGLDLEPEDYAWTTRKILEIADICCQGRVVSVLEGGYGRTPSTVPGSDGGLDRALFADCAVRHLQAMIDPYDTEKRFAT
jgi:SHAQKYF class myb-like DNA-binding protein